MIRLYGVLVLKERYGLLLPLYLRDSLVKGVGRRVYLCVSMYFREWKGAWEGREDLT